MKTNPNLEPEEYFGKPENAYHKQYRAMLDFFHHKMTAEEVAARHGSLSVLFTPCPGILKAN